MNNPNTTIIDRGLVALLQNVLFEYVGLQHLKNVTNDGFAHFGKLNNLKELQTQAWTGINDKKVLSLEDYTFLAIFYPVSSNMTDRGLGFLLQIKDKLLKLETPYLNYSKVTTSGIAHLQRNWGCPINVHFVS